jgi:hypothetical protein
MCSKIDVEHGEVNSPAERDAASSWMKQNFHWWGIPTEAAELQRHRRWRPHRVSTGRHSRATAAPPGGPSQPPSRGTAT